MNRLALFLFIFFIGCFGDVGSEMKSDELAFFDLKGFIESEVTDLDAKNIVKVTEVNGQKETLKLDAHDFKSDLKIFSDADINKPSWVDKYSTEKVTADNGEVSQLKYEAQDPKLKTKSLQVDFLEGQVSKIQIVKASSSAISEVSETLVYNPTSGYKIERSQDISIAGKNNFMVEVKFDRTVSNR